MTLPDNQKPKRDYTKFFTYPETAIYMAKLLDARSGEMVLEPSAGNGALVSAVKKYCATCIIDAVELYPKWEKDLKAAGSHHVFIRDFLDIPLYHNYYDKCIANPPFGNGVDLQAHFDKICDLVKDGGKVVMIVPEEFNPTYEKHFIKNYTAYPLENWSKNSDGTTTPIKIISFINS